ncbi:MAG TPA: cytochrome P450 [Gaiellaceae bacterium]|nr:cytochrome P450 [Gaiellaceae bacterium]
MSRFFTPEFFVDPYPTYEVLQGEPVRVRPSGLPLGATGRDPRQFPEPNRFDIGRSPNRHLQFGIGPHFCIGAAPARVEIQLALAGLLARFRRIEFAGDVIRWHEIAAFRGPKAVPLALGR